MVSSGMTAASPPKFVTLEEIMQAANGMRDMALVHQIVVDDDFKLQKVDPPPNTLHQMVNDTMKKAFWDLLRNELGEDPPSYTQVIIRWVNHQPTRDLVVNLRGESPVV